MYATAQTGVCGTGKVGTKFAKKPRTVTGRSRGDA
jgi:hypothetical protein